MKRKQLKKIMAVAAAAACIAAGCGTDSASDGKAAQDNTAAEASADEETSADGETVEDGEESERKEVRREDYPDCDGSGHGYVEIYYSDGTMETEEY